MPAALVGPLLVVFTSAEGVTVVRTMALVELPLLFEASGSKVEAVPAATLVSVPLPGAVTVTVKLVLVTFVIAGHVTTPAEEPPPPDALTKVALGGSVSLTTMFVALFGPRLVKVMV